MAGVEKKKYIAKVGLNLEGGKRNVRVEAGEVIPISLDEKEIRELIANGDIEEAK